MENNYNILGAKTALSMLLNGAERNEAISPHEKLWLFKSENYRVHQTNSPPTFKLVKKSEDLTELEEATFVVYGIILEKDLPPINIESRFLRDEQSRNHYAGVIRQYVAITGLNVEDFNKILEGLGRIHRHFEDSLPNDNFQPVTPLIIDDNITMACHTRYFNAIRHCRSAVAYPLGADVDPNGELEHLRGTSHIHTEDNAVQYLGKRIEEEKTKYFKISPTRFQKGDIVEMVVSIFCIRIRTGDLKMLTSLKSLILVDDKFRESAREDRVKASISHHMKTPSLRMKRRFIETEDEGDLLLKWARMDL